MYPAITFKSILASSPGGKYKMIITVLIHYLCIYYPVIVIGIPVITGRTYKLFIHYGNKIPIHTYILIHISEKWNYAFIIYTLSLIHISEPTRLLSISYAV